MVSLSLLLAGVAATAASQDPAFAVDVPEQQPADFSVPSTERAFWAETFQNTTTTKLFEGTTWVKSAGKKYREQKISVKRGSKLLGKFAADKALVLDNKAQHYGFAAKLPEPFYLDGSKGKKSLVVQYEVKYPEVVKCAGTYLKLLRDSPTLNVTDLNDKTPFTIMFGPDKCDKNNKVQFIFNHRNPVTNMYEEKALQISPEVKNDKLSHVYTLAIHDDNTFEMYADLNLIKNGSLYTLFKPAVLLPKEIDDPTDLKPTTWEETEFIPDPAAVKPAEWDEDAPRTIPNLSLHQPPDWDEAARGPWRQPMMSNPEYRGKWSPPMIENPDYVGEWEPRKIPNPDYFDDPHPARMDPIGAVALEVWSMSENIRLDNFWLGHNLNDAKKFARLTWQLKHEAEKKAVQMEPEPKKPTPPESKKKEPNVFDRIDEAVAWVVKYPLVAGLGAFFVFLVLLGFRGTPHHARSAFPMSPVIQEVLDLDKNKDTSQVPRVPVDGTELRHRPATATTTTQQA
ncbi:hypothetical protein H257_12009 [Aphanomyces astaci]|uniref:Calnexin n=1 Tax=Aphanomyces astaci TaxID=112090 RepID=W4G2D2_APHAT|nr:hypothetical protein H257_12009 [Aphanomyces astaci]ETV73204.1 hypothetical protein H257_12009 [Aphanomyces astaci]|eukprot:XP_009837409.1 hypothetical protein H257_12009 [Aphanomyces astaci]